MRCFHSVIFPWLLRLTDLLPAYDSWVTVGITDGDSKNALSQIGIDWSTFDNGVGLGTSDGMFFWMVSGAAFIDHFLRLPLIYSLL